LHPEREKAERTAGRPRRDNRLTYAAQTREATEGETEPGHTYPVHVEKAETGRFMKIEWEAETTSFRKTWEVMGSRKLKERRVTERRLVAKSEKRGP